MLLLSIGAKGGLGTTTLAYQISQCAGALPLDAADGQLLRWVGGAGLDLSAVPQWTASRRSRAVEHLIRTRPALLWTPACNVWAAAVAAFVRDLAAVGHVSVDGGLAPPAPLVDLATVILIVSSDDPVARWHEQRLKQQWPQARALVGDVQAAAPALVEQLLGVPPRQAWWKQARSWRPTGKNA